jgi:hypothetical protein
VIFKSIRSWKQQGVVAELLQQSLHSPQCRAVTIDDKNKALGQE